MGAGRPKNPFRSVSRHFYIPEHIDDYLNIEPNKSAKLAEILEQYYSNKNRSDEWIHKEIERHERTINQLKGLLEENKKKRRQKEEELKQQEKKLQSELELKKNQLNTFINIIKDWRDITPDNIRKYYPFSDGKSDEQLIEIRDKILSDKFKMEEFV